MEATPTLTDIACNQAVVIGELVQSPERKDLPSGAEVVSFSLTVRADGQKTTSVPLSWFNPPKRVDRWKVGDQIVAVGPVVRRFYQAGGATGSRTDIDVRHAESLASTRSRRLLDRAESTLNELAIALDVALDGT